MAKMTEPEQSSFSTESDIDNEFPELEDAGLKLMVMQQ